MPGTKVRLQFQRKGVQFFVSKKARSLRMDPGFIDLSSDEEDARENHVNHQVLGSNSAKMSTANSHGGDLRESMQVGGLDALLPGNESRNLQNQSLLLLPPKAVKKEVDFKDLILPSYAHEVSTEAVAGFQEQNALDAQRENHNHSVSAMQIVSNGSIVARRSPLALTPQSIVSSEQVQQSKCSRQFWRAGNYETKISRPKLYQGAMDHVRVHPKFLHSNATSHKWAFGAIAELLDNAIDEVMNGATYVKVDKIINPRDKSPALLVQDNGGGMDPDCIRHCMSLGYSRKNTNTTIGQYGNGFKTSTMRLGADVIVFSRSESNNGIASQSIGLLSYTFLRETGHEDTIVPMVDYELTGKPRSPRRMLRTTLEDWTKNLTTIMQWSPYASEDELLSQFTDMDSHGTKIVVYNMWLNDDGLLELDFDSDEQDIKLRDGKKLDKGEKLHSQLVQNHISNELRYSLRAYASVLYLKVPPNFQIILRGKPVEHKSIAADLKFPEYIVYKPQLGGPSKDSGFKEACVTTTIGFTKEAPLVNVHGFNVYHKNRLIMPFWKVWQDNSSRGRGVVGVLEANFIEPAHDKQDFEKTTLLLRLETRLKQMTIEYWNLHCELIGYQRSKPRNQQKTVEGTLMAKLSAPMASVPALSSIPPNFSAGYYPRIAAATGAMTPFNHIQYQASASVQPHPSFTMPIPVQGNAMAYEVSQVGSSAPYPFHPSTPGTDIKPSIIHHPTIAAPFRGNAHQEPLNLYGTVDCEPLVDSQHMENIDGIVGGQHRTSCPSFVSSNPAQVCPADILMDAQARGSRHTNEPDHGPAPCQGNGVKIVADSVVDSLKRKEADFHEPNMQMQQHKFARLGNEGSLFVQTLNSDLQLDSSRACQSELQEAVVATLNSLDILNLLEENKELQSRCEEYQRRDQAWQDMVQRLERELIESKTKYIKLMKEIQDSESWDLDEAFTGGGINFPNCHPIKSEIV